jgi:hypothetical protein
LRQSEFDKITAALDRAEFALEELRKKEVQLHRKRYLAKSMEEIEALNSEAADLLLALRKSMMQFTPAIRPLICGWSPILSKRLSWTNDSRHREGVC